MPLSKRIIRLPVKLVDGQWELLYGGPVKVEDGAFGELRIDRTHFTDPKFLAALTKKRKVLVLPAGTELRVALSIRPGLDESLSNILLDSVETQYDRADAPSRSTRFVSVFLGGPTRGDLNKRDFTYAKHKQAFDFTTAARDPISA
jgi:hypothetical protein